MAGKNSEVGRVRFHQKLMDSSENVALVIDAT